MSLPQSCSIPELSLAPTLLHKLLPGQVLLIPEAPDGIIQQWAHEQINPSVPVATCTSLLLHSSISHANYACL